MIQWRPLVTSLIISLTVGVPGMVLLVKGTKVPRKKHLLNVFSQTFFALLFTSSFVRSFYWVCWTWPGDPVDPDSHVAQQIGLPIGMRAFLITYPQVNILIIAYLIQYPWLYDYLIIQHGHRIYLQLRNQMKVFVIASNIFIVLLYLVYTFSFPINSDEPGGELFNLYSTLMVFSIISAILVMCQLLSAARRIEGINAEYGKAIKVKGSMFLAANVTSAIVFFLLTKEYVKLGEPRYFVSGLIFQWAFFTITELLPVIAFVRLNQKFVEVIESTQRNEQ